MTNVNTHWVDILLKTLFINFSTKKITKNNFKKLSFCRIVAQSMCYNEKFYQKNALLILPTREITVCYPDLFRVNFAHYQSPPQIKPKMAAIISLFLLLAFQQFFQAVKSESPIPDEAWDYVEVRPNAFMFWWLYGAQINDPTEREQKPLVMWLQGGPGSSSTGFGNFEEIGPLDVNLKPRNTTWIKEANVLFVDNPVGCGYSYVVDPSALTRNISGKLLILSWGK